MSSSDMPTSRVGARLRAARKRRAARGSKLRSHLERSGLTDRAQDVLTSILNISSEGVVVVDSEMRILLFSRGAQAIFGYQQREMLGKPLERLIPSPHRAQHRRHTQRFAEGAVQSRRMSGRSEVLGLTKTGAVIPLEVGLSRLSTPNGKIFTALVRDVSHRRQVEAALEQAAADAQAANLAKSAFLAAMSHEIRTPLNGVLGMTQAMAMEEMSPRQRERLEVIRRSGESLLAVLNDLLDLSKIEAGKLVLEHADFDLDDVVSGAHATFSALAEAKGLAFEFRVSPGARGMYRGDPLRVRQILHNLVSNALKFTEKGSVRVVVSRRKDGALLMRIRDTGIGIPTERAAQLFKKFEQGDASTTRRFGGTGLGLAICRDLAEMMGGSITVSSRVGKGAVFDVVLALTKVAHSPAPQACRQAPDAAREPLTVPELRVLVAEDNSVNQLVLRTLLEQIGVRPTIVADGRAALEAWQAAHWDLILMDVQMPEMDGPTAAGMIRSRERAQGRHRTPIYALTANAMNHQRHEYEAAGMDGLIAKPIEVEKLFAVLLEIDRSKAGRVDADRPRSATPR